MSIINKGQKRLWSINFALLLVGNKRMPLGNSMDSYSFMSAFDSELHISSFLGGSYRDSPGYAIRCNTENSLKDMLMYSKPRGPKRLYYQKISIRIDELENKVLRKALIKMAED